MLLVVQSLESVGIDVLGAPVVMFARQNVEPRLRWKTLLDGSGSWESDIRQVCPTQERDLFEFIPFIRFDPGEVFDYHEDLSRHPRSVYTQLCCPYCRSQSD
jgi:hypothetical protein